MQAVTTTITRSSLERRFALCESCFWSATVFGRDNMPACPSCAGGNVSLIPLAKDEEYRLRVSASDVVEMSFSRAKKA